MNKEEYYARMFINECERLIDSSYDFNRSIWKTTAEGDKRKNAIINRYYWGGAYNKFLQLKEKYEKKRSNREDQEPMI